LAVVPAGAAHAAAPSTPNPMPPQSSGWGEWLTYYRALAGLPSVSVDSNLNDGDWQHSRYMVETGHFAHDEDVTSPYATDAGANAAAHSNIFASSGAVTDSREPVDAWADSLGHGLWMLNPRLQTVGFGMFTDPSSPSPLVTAAALDVLSAPQGPAPSSPVTLPFNGAAVAARAFPEATENTVSSCPGYATGLPVLFVFWPTNPSGSAASVTRNGAGVAACTFDSASYTNADGWQSTISSIMASTAATAIVLSEPLRRGASYSVSVSAGSQHLSWSFQVAAESGYWLTTLAGDVYAFGGAEVYGQRALSGPVVDIEATPSGNGYWQVDATGSVASYGDARYFGGNPALSSGEIITSLSTTPSGDGYWLFSSDGRVFPYGAAAFRGDMSGVTLNGPVLDSVSTASGNGYFMVASDGGIFAFGDAVFTGSMGGSPLNAPVQSLVPDGDGMGYWLVAADGGVFAFDAPFRGSMGGQPLNQPVTGMVRYGNGYVLVAADGGIFDFSDQAFYGSLGSTPPDSPVISVTSTR
jgi:hypothetical protein